MFLPGIRLLPPRAGMIATRGPAAIVFDLWAEWGTGTLDSTLIDDPGYRSFRTGIVMPP